MDEFDAAALGFQLRLSQARLEAAITVSRQITEAQMAVAKAKAEARAANMAFENLKRAAKQISGA
jgi:hypothetical protein